MNVNLIGQLKIEIAFYEFAVQYVNNYTTRIPSNLFDSSYYTTRTAMKYFVWILASISLPKYWIYARMSALAWERLLGRQAIAHSVELSREHG